MVVEEKGVHLVEHVLEEPRTSHDTPYGQVEKQDVAPLAAMAVPNPQHAHACPCNHRSTKTSKAKTALVTTARTDHDTWRHHPFAM